MSPSVLSVLGQHVTSLPCDSEQPRAMGDGYTVKPNHFSLSNSQTACDGYPPRPESAARQLESVLGHKDGSEGLCCSPSLSSVAFSYLTPYFLFMNITVPSA